jgi:hypothetical protein
MQARHRLGVHALLIPNPAQPLLLLLLLLLLLPVHHSLQASDQQGGCSQAAAAQDGERQCCDAPLVLSASIASSISVE